jgi:hypothetical protein
MLVRCGVAQRLPLPDASSMHVDIRLMRHTLPCCTITHQDYMSEADPVTYSNMSYTTIEISARLAALQQQHIVKVCAVLATVGQWLRLHCLDAAVQHTTQHPLTRTTLTRCPTPTTHIRSAATSSPGGWWRVTPRSLKRGRRWAPACPSSTAWASSTALC